MSTEGRCGLAGVCILVTALVGQVRAENEGEEDLDRATRLKVVASNLSELTAVIRLCESALEKGLDEDDKAFAETLLASTRIRRGMEAAKEIFSRMPPDPRWPEYRRFALKDLEKGVELNPEQPQALLAIAKLNLLPGGDVDRTKKALDDAVRFSQEDPTLKAQALMLRAGLTEDSDKKLADLDEAIRSAPNELLAIRARAGLFADQGENEKALTDLDRAVELAPDHAPTYIARAVVLIELGRYDDALIDLDKAHEIQPNSALPFVHKARIRGLQEDFRAALDELNRGHEIDSANVTVLILRASVYQELEESDKALADLEDALSLRPGLPEALRLRAMVLAGEGKFDEAIAELEKVQKAGPADLTDQLRLAMFYAADEKAHKAIEIYTKVLEQEPENLFALAGRANALLVIGKHAEAIADYEKALKLDPEDSGVLNNLSWVLSTSPDDKIRNGKRALDLALKACEVTQYKKAHILSTLAAAYAEMGDFKTAIKWSQKAVEFGSAEEQEALQKELDSYRAEKPFRELLTAPEPEKEEAEESEKPEPEEP
jgi:tetratricopeptide (TPR) repeat protein